MPTYEKGNKFLTKFMVGGKRHSRMTDTRAEGEAWELEARAALKLGKPLPEAEKKSVGGVDAGTIGQLHRTVDRMHWSSLRDPKASLNGETFTNWVGPNVPVAEALTAETIERFVDEHLLGVRGVSNSTINRYLSSISTYVKYAGKRLPEKPDFAHLWRKEGEGRIRWFSDEEEALVAQTWTLWGKRDELDFFLFLIDTGARTFKEGQVLPWKDIANRKVTFWDTKNGKPRTVPLTTRSWDAIQRLKARKGNQTGPFVHLDKVHMDGLWERTRVHLPVLHDTVLYTCRHTCASRLVQGGADLMRVKEWMGHKSIQTTMRYAHLAPQHLMDIAHLLDRPAHKLRVV